MNPIIGVKTMTNFLTFDIEEWFHASLLSLKRNELSSYAKTSHLEMNVERLMEICDVYSIRSTCFVLGTVARKKPQIVRMIDEGRHEIASHGYRHELVCNMSAKEFRADIRKSKRILEDITGKEVVGYRAPSWSVKEEILGWFYDILAEEGFLYSSSVYPGYTFLYGIPGFPDYPHFPSVGRGSAEILEIPCSVLKIMGKRVGFSGGFYLRLFPIRFILYNVRRMNQAGKPAIVYVHPTEIDAGKPRIPLSCVNSFIQYYNTKNTEQKLIEIVGRLTFSTISDYAAFHHGS